jgi:ATP synthase I chain
MTPKTDPTLRRTMIAVAVLGAAMAVFAFGYFGVKEGLSVLAGTLVATANLFVLARSVAKLLGGGSPAWAGVAFLKFVVLLAATFVLVRSPFIDALGLAVGFGALPLGIFVAGTSRIPDAPSLEKETDHA